MEEYRVANFEYKVKICDHILDNIYGQIGLTEVEKKIERLPIFKRLHNLSQLGLVNWIFPCALHTRYIHSIGVMHIAGEMASRININMGEDFFCDSEIQILRLTGLLHDIGHYPLSHNIEFAYKDAQQAEKYREEPVSQNLKHFVNCPSFLVPDCDEPEVVDPEEIKDQKLKAEESFAKGFSGSSGFHHENIGNQIIIHNKDIRQSIRDYFVLLKTDSGVFLNPFFAPVDDHGCKKENATNEEVEKIVDDLLIAIGNLVIGNYAYEQDGSCHWMEKYSAMIQLIHSDLDADNLDYLLRDATFSGTSYGIMDMGILLNCLYVKKLTDSSSESISEEEKKASNYHPARYIVGITKKGVGAAEQFLLGKFMAYSQMILSKSVSILEAMILRVESESIIQKDKDYKGSLLMEMVTRTHTDIRYLRFSDFYVFDKLYSLAEYMNEFRTLPRAIISRLTHTCAFDLEMASYGSECICVGTDVNSIASEFGNNPLYQEFVKDYNTIKDKSGKELAEGDSEEKLFAYRFEQYSLTKEIPIDEFENKFIFSEMKPSRRFDFHYYRLGNGIPILDPLKEYTYSELKEGKPDLSKIPQLCVDSQLSALKDLRKMQFVALRKYKICDYASQ